MAFEPKINFQIAEQIRNDAKGGESYSSIARRYKLNPATISHICNYQTWTGKPKRTHGHKLDKNVVKLILECKASGFTYQEIVERFDISWRTVHNICTKKIWVGNKVKLNHELAKKIRSLYDDGGHTIRSLAKQFKVGKSTIASVLNEKTWAHISPAVRNYLETEGKFYYD